MTLLTSLFVGSMLAVPAIASATPQRGVAVRASGPAYRVARQPAVRARPAARRAYRNSFYNLRTKLRRAWSDQRRIRILSRAAHLRLTMAQTCELLVTFRSSSMRLDALRMISDQIIDPRNVRVLDEAFAWRSQRRAARRIVRNSHRFARWDRRWSRGWRG